MNTIIYLCSVHLLKNVIKKSKIVNIHEKVRKAFIYCFALLQNSVDVNGFNFILFNVFKLFNTKVVNNSFLEAFYQLRNEVQNHKLQSIDVSNDCIDESKSELQNFQIVFSSQETTENVKKNSPYTSYFEALLKKYQTVEETEEAVKKNDYYSPELFNIILDYLQLFPFWNGTLIHGILLKYPSFKIKSRLDNNCVENNFGYIKNNLFQNVKQMPSAMTALLYDRYKMKYIMHYLQQEENLNSTTLGKNS